MARGLKLQHDDDQSFVGLGSGAVPVLVHVPHSGLGIPDDVRDEIVLDDDALRFELWRMTDHRTDVLAELAIAAGATAFVNRLSRLVIDPERFLEPEQESMEEVGMGAVYRSTADGEVLRDISTERREAMLNRWFHPYAEALADTVDKVLGRHGRCTIIDLHSFPAERSPYELGDEHRPEICIGTDPEQTPDWVIDLTEATVGAHGFEALRDTPFAGTYVPLRHWDDDRVTSVMIEVRRDIYLDSYSADVPPGDTWVRPSGGEARVADLAGALATAIAAHDP